ncbi:type 1 glutamine amidotransferase domain-containing protein [Ulvibacterium sp.]|uniref:type 1 glutamine amidotransferase domain-containing protein n=1 Tax=Ulvibacterium sp. TaxID=2665914 RepID=UPI003CC66BC0
MKKALIALLSSAFLFSCGNKTKGSTVSNQEKNTKQEKRETMKRILFVITSHDKLGTTGDKTGVWLEEFTGPYYFLKDKGVAITLASPKGGKPPIDPKSELPDFQTSSTKRFNEDKEAQNVFSKTIKLETAKQTDYDAVFYTGGYGPLWDLADNEKSIALIEAFYNSNKPVASVCHGPAIFKNTKDLEDKPLVAGKKVTAYSNSEEAAIDFTNVVPFSVEDVLKENGGIYSKGADWNPYAVEDGLLVTGQNPASSELVAELLLEKLN